MRRKNLLAVISGTTAVMLLTSLAAADEIKWAPSYREARKTAKENGALMILDFYTDW